MTTLLDKKRSATANVQSSDEATLDQVPSHHCGLRRRSRGSLPTLRKVGDCERSSYSLRLLNRHFSTADLAGHHRAEQFPACAVEAHHLHLFDRRKIVRARVDLYAPAAASRAPSS
jgi:hypothetical protein